MKKHTSVNRTENEHGISYAKQEYFEFHTDTEFLDYLTDHLTEVRRIYNRHCRESATMIKISQEEYKQLTGIKNDEFFAVTAPELQSKKVITKKDINKTISRQYSLE